MKRIAIIIAGMWLTVLGLGGAGLASPIVSADTPKQVICNTLDSGADCTKPKDTNGVDINHVVTVVINTFSIVIGILGVIMVMVAGFKYVTSAGDSSKVSSAKSTLVYALLGLVIAVLSKAIVSFVLDKVKG